MYTQEQESQYKLAFHTFLLPFQARPVPLEINLFSTNRIEHSTTLYKNRLRPLVTASRAIPRFSSAEDKKEESSESINSLRGGDKRQ